MKNRIALIALFVCAIVLVSLLVIATFPGVVAARPLLTTIAQYGTKSTWPADSDWKAITSLNDPHDASASHEACDFVGDATNPGAYLFSDSNYWYLRVRVDEGIVGSGTVQDAILILIDNTGDSQPDYAFSWDAKSASITQHGLELQIPDTIGSTWSNTQMKDIDGDPARKVSPPDFALPATGTDGYIRTVDSVSTTNFGTTTYIDFAVSWSFLSTNTTLTKTQAWKIQLGSIANSTDHNNIDCDVAGGKAPSDSGLSWTSLANPTAVTLTDFWVSTSGNSLPLGAVGVLSAILVGGTIVVIRFVQTRREQK